MAARCLLSCAGMDCDFIVIAAEDEPERRSSIVRTGWESVVFELDDEPDESYFDSSDC